MEKFQVEFKEFFKAPNYVYCLGISKSLPIIACGGTFDNVITINYETEQVFQTLERSHKLPLLQLIFTKDNRLIQLGFDHYIVIYNYQNGQFKIHQKIETINIHHRYALLIQNDTMIVSVGDKNQINFVNLETHQIQSIVLSEYNAFTSLASNNSNKIAIVAGRVGVLFLDLENKKIFKYNQRFFTFYMKPSNNMALYAQGGCKIRCQKTNKIIRRFQSDFDHTDLIIKFTNDDKYCILGGMDCFLRIYNVISGELQVIESHYGYIFAIEFLNDDENVFFTGSRDYRILKWTKKILKD